MIYYPWKMYGRYADEMEDTVCGNDEQDCLMRLIELAENHGGLVFYTGVGDEDYVDGEYIGKENFIYE